MKFFAKFNRAIKMAAVALVVGGAMLAVPSGKAHAIDISVLVGGGTQGKGAACVNQSNPGVYLYSDINYQGRCAYFAPNLPISPFNYDAIKRYVGNDKASSMRIVNSSSTRFYVDLYKDADFKGEWNQTDSSIPDFRTGRAEAGYYIAPVNDSVSSMLVSWY